MSTNSTQIIAIPTLPKVVVPSHPQWPKLSRGGTTALRRELKNFTIQQDAVLDARLLH